MVIVLFFGVVIVFVMWIVGVFILVWFILKLFNKGIIFF